MLDSASQSHLLALWPGFVLVIAMNLPPFFAGGGALHPPGPPPAQGPAALAAAAAPGGQPPGGAGGRVGAGLQLPPRSPAARAGPDQRPHVSASRSRSSGSCWEMKGPRIEGLLRDAPSGAGPTPYCSSCAAAAPVPRALLTCLLLQCGDRCGAGQQRRALGAVQPGRAAGTATGAGRCCSWLGHLLLLLLLLAATHFCGAAIERPLNTGLTSACLVPPWTGQYMQVPSRYCLECCRPQVAAEDWQVPAAELAVRRDLRGPEHFVCRCGAGACTLLPLSPPLFDNIYAATHIAGCHAAHTYSMTLPPHPAASTPPAAPMWTTR